MKKTSYRLPKSLRDSMWAGMRQQGYGQRAKSKWIREALRGYLETDARRGFARVGVSDDIEPNNLTEVVYLDEGLVEEIEQATTIIRKQTPLMEGVRSAIIRAAMRWRLRK